MNTNHFPDASLHRTRSVSSDEVLLPEPKRIKLEDEHSMEIGWEDDPRHTNELLENSSTLKNEGLDNFPSKNEQHDAMDEFLLSDGGLTPSLTGPANTVKSEYLAYSLLKPEPRDGADDILVSDDVSPRTQMLEVLNGCKSTSICPGLLIALRDAVAKVEDETIAEAKLARKLKDIGDFCSSYSGYTSVVSSLANFRELVTWLISISVELGLSEDRLVDQAIIQDELAMVGSMTSVMANEGAHEQVYTLHGDAANHFLNALQEFLDKTGPFRHLLSPSNGHLCPDYDTLHLAARQMLLKLSSDSNTIPSSFLLKRIRPHSIKLGSGTFADVFQADYDGQLVALKLLRTFQNSQNSGHRDKDHKSLCRESLPWRQLKHPRIVPFLGIDTDSFAPFYCMVSLLIKNGNLFNYVNNHRHDEHGYDGIDLVKLFADIADGLSYLHGQAVIHGDLRAENVLVDESQRACISDFGLISFIESVDHSTTIRGNPRFMAPELLNGTQDQRTTASDIYSFASLCIQVMTGEKPFKDAKVDGAVIYKVMQGEKPARPEAQLFPPSIPTDVFWDLLHTCWDRSPDSRPSAQDLVNRLQSSRHNVPESVHKPANLENGSPESSAEAMAEGWRSPGEVTHAGNREGRTETCLWENCGRSYNDLSGLVAHIEGDHVRKGKSIYTCEWATCNCRGLMLAGRTALITHMRGHRSEKPSLTRSDALKKHTRVQHYLPPSGAPAGPGFPGHPTPEPGDWYAVWNPKVKKAVDVALVHTLVHERYLIVVCCVRFSADGKYLATVCDRTAQIYDVETGQKMCVLVDKGAYLYIRSVCFSPDDKYLATAEGTQIKIWDIAKKQIRNIFNGHSQSITSLEFSRNGRLIVSGAWDEAVRIWDMDAVEPAGAAGLPKVLRNEDPDRAYAGVTSVAISPDGQLVATGSQDNVVRIWDVGTGALLWQLSGHNDRVSSVAFTPDGKGLVSGSWDKTLKYWDIRQVPPNVPRCTMNFLGHGGFVRSVAVTADGQWVVSEGNDCSVQLLDPQSATLQPILMGHKDYVWSVDPSPQGGVLASGGGFQARIWSYTAL